MFCRMAVTRRATETEKPLSVLLNDELRAKLEARALRDDMKMAQVIRAALRRYLDDESLAS
jgi:hypothetical protein